MDRGKAGFRRARWGGVCALALTCCCLIAGSSAQQDATTPAKKTATSKSSTHHKTTSTASAASSSTHTASKSHSRKKKSAKVRGQQKIDSERARSIQEALIREHYMTGEATGTWNQASEDAMRKYQADHGWQSKQVPDSRALIKLGLGPSNDHLLNPESAMITNPDAPRAESMPTTSHTTAPSADPPPAPNPRPISRRFTRRVSPASRPTELTSGRFSPAASSRDGFGPPTPCSTWAAISIFRTTTCRMC